MPSTSTRRLVISETGGWTVTPFDQLLLALLQQILTRLGLFSQFDQTVLSDLSLIESQTALIGSGQTPADLAVPTILARLDNLSAGIGATQALINFAFNRLGTPPFTVTLPSTPPPGYGGGASAHDVWTYTVVGDSRSTGDRQVTAGAFANLLGPFLAAPALDNPIFSLVYDFANGSAASPPTITPDCVFGAILAGDTVGSWLNRIDTQGNVWVLQADGFWTSGNNIAGFGYWRCNIDPAWWAEIKAVFFPTTSAVVAPVWPGLANVTLGASLALSNGLTVPGPLEGVIVDITAVSPPISFYPFGAIRSYVRAGALVFVDDHGDAEFPAPFGPDHEVICPRQMERAAHAVVRLSSGVVGTITPWIHM